jgi:hypothetical protein
LPPYKPDQNINHFAAASCLCWKAIEAQTPGKSQQFISPPIERGFVNKVADAINL